MPLPFDLQVLPDTPATPPPESLRDYPHRELRRGEALYRVGDEARGVYRVEEGLLKLAFDVADGRERVLGLAGPGEWLGALAPNHLRFLERAVALSPRVLVRALPREGLEPDLERRLFDAAGVQLVRWREALEDGERPVLARLARTLLRLGERFGQQTDDGTLRLTLPVTHEILAAMVGAARETTTALVSELRTQGAVEGTRGRYRLHPEALRDAARAGLDARY